jgi:voltage-gated potassium channel
VTALLGAFSLFFGFFHDLRDAFRDQKTRVLLLWVFVLLLIGTIFYSAVEGWNTVDAFYFSVVTLTTVGYGDLSPATTSGKLFTTIFIFLGISIIVVFANTLAHKHAERVSAHLQGSDSESAADQEPPGQSAGS